MVTVFVPAERSWVQAPFLHYSARCQNRLLLLDTESAGTSEITQGVFTPGKSFSSLSVVRTKIQCLSFGLVRFLFTLQFSQQSQNLTTNPHVCKDHSIIGQKGLGRGKEFNKKKGAESAGESNQSWISSVIYIDLRTGPTHSPSS